MAHDIKKTVENLENSYNTDLAPFLETAVFPYRHDSFPEIQMLRELMFPRHWNATELLKAPYGRTNLETKLKNLGCKIHDGIHPGTSERVATSEALMHTILEALPIIRETLKTDVEAAYKGDPSAQG